MTIPRTTKAIVIRKSSQSSTVEGKYDDVVLVDRQVPELGDGEILVKTSACAFNHRELWIRKGLYPDIVYESVIGADGAGTVVASSTPNDPLLNQRVFLTPSRGWEKDPIAPEFRFGTVGGGAHPPIGTFSEYIVVERSQVIPTPDHLTDTQAAAWPLGALTAWRATMINADVQPGQNVLITGIGGGVALIALQLCIAKGAFVYVTSGNPEKIRKAIELGAKGGANYKNKDWPKEISDLLKKNGNGKNTQLDSIIDSGGGEIMNQLGRYLKQGGKFVVYGMTASLKMTFTMRQVLANQKLLGSTMGSHQDLIDATEFLKEHRIVPIVSHVLDGLESVEEGFELLKSGDHFGKVVIKIREGQLERSRL